jgi:transglutaminase/protease-like cytokinesis protein 3
VYGQKIDYSAVDARIWAMKNDPSTDLKKQVSELTNGLANNFLKTRAIFDWVALNIKYDWETYNNKQNERPGYVFKSPAMVLEQRIGICSEISELMKEMLTNAGIECVIVDGTVSGMRPGDIDTHAWNAVKLNDKWYLMDCTWAGTMSMKNGEVEFFYFLTPPEQFIASHRPEDKKWSLLDQMISVDGFSALPIIDPCFFKYSGKPYPLKSTLTAKNGKLVIDNYVKAGSKQYIQIENGNDIISDYMGMSQSTSTDNTAVSYDLKEIPKGEYLLNVGVYVPAEGEDGLDEIKTMLVFNLIIE